MNPRTRRLISDLNGMNETAELSGIKFVGEGNPPETYEVEFNVPGIALEERRIVERDRHRCEVYLHRDYPRRPPVITWKTPVFHPNLLGPERNGGVCIGAWKASESLSDLMMRLRDLISYRDFSLEDALDTDAADWVSRFRLRPGFNIEEVLGIDVAKPDDPLVINLKRRQNV